MANILLHVGFPKAGSTFLQKWFKEHPEIYYQPKHIAQGFYNAWQLADDMQHSNQVYENYVLSCEDFMLWQGRPNWYGLTGTGEYDYRIFQQRICETLFSLFPNAKVLLITRGYQTVFSSIYAQYISMGGIQSCEEFMSVNHNMLSTFYDYNYSIDLYRRTFRKENVVVLPFELLKDNPQKFQAIIEKQFSIKQKFDFTTEKENSSMDVKNLNAYYRTSRFVYQLLKPFPHHLQTKLYLKYCDIIRAKVPHPALQFVASFLRETIQLNGTDSIVSLMKGKAEIFREEELYQPYLSQYLID